MKKTTFLLIIIILIFVFTACATQSTINVYENAKIVRTNFDYESEPVMIMKSVDDIEVYKNGVKEIAQNEEYFSQSYKDEFAAKVDDFFSVYDDAYFEDKLLYVAVIVEGSGSISHNVTSIEYGEDTMTVTIAKTSPEICTCDMAQWHLLVEVSLADFNGAEGKLIGA